MVLRRQLRQAYRRIFDRLETALLAQQGWEASWQVADRAKGQSFTDFLEGPYPPLDRQSRLAFLRTRRQLDNAYRHRKGDVERLECLLDRTLADSKRDYKRDYDPNRAPFPWRPWPALQGCQTALVEFSRCSQGLGAYLVRDGQVCYQALQSPPETEEMYDRITEWWGRQQDWLHRYQEAVDGDNVLATTLTDASSQPWVQLLLDWLTTERQRWQVETAQWTQRLLVPLAAELQGVQRLLVVPDGALLLRPWSGLWDEEQAEYLRDRFAGGICVLPGSRIGQLLSQRKPTAVVAPTLVARPAYFDSDLLCTELEARWVSLDIA